MIPQFITQNALDLCVEAIQYIPEQHCPECGAPPTVNRLGQWYVPYQDFYGTALVNWQDYFGYVYFACQCRCHGLPTPGVWRVARLGDAIIPLEFTGNNLVTVSGMKTDLLNSNRVAQAIDFLACHADPTRITGMNPIIKMLLSVSSGTVGVEEGRICITGWLNSPPLGVQVSPIPTQLQQP